MAFMELATWDLETLHWRAGWSRVAGIDEAGRGAWAGPLAVGLVIFPVPEDGQAGPEFPFCDSKSISPKRREVLAALVKEEAIFAEVEFAFPAEIDALNVSGVTRAAALRLIERAAPDALVTDCLKLQTDLPIFSPPRADASSQSVAAASILAKVTRDAYMRKLHESCPEWGFAQHKGYGSAVHGAVLRTLGPTEHHRLSYRPVREAARNLSSET